MPLRRIIFDTTLLLEVANCCVETNILRMPCIPLHRLSVVSDCLLIVTLRLGYRATGEIMLADYWRLRPRARRREDRPAPVRSPFFDPADGALHIEQPTASLA